MMFNIIQINKNHQKVGGCLLNERMNAFKHLFSKEYQCG